jgi:hypothetical protein
MAARSLTTIELLSACVHLSERAGHEIRRIFLGGALQTIDKVHRAHGRCTDVVPLAPTRFRGLRPTAGASSASSSAWLRTRRRLRTSPARSWWYAMRPQLLRRRLSRRASQVGSLRRQWPDLQIVGEEGELQYSEAETEVSDAFGVP